LERNIQYPEKVPRVIGKHLKARDGVLIKSREKPAWMSRKNEPKGKAADYE
jgi:hypothetical protein